MFETLYTVFCCFLLFMVQYSFYKIVKYYLYDYRLTHPPKEWYI